MMMLFSKRSLSIAIFFLLTQADVLAGEPPAPPSPSLPPSALCLNIRASLEKEIASIGRLAPEKQSRRLDAFDRDNENPESCNAERLIEAQDAAELQLVRLLASGTSIAPAKVFRCTRLETEDKKCNGYYSDDTPSSREGRVGNDQIPVAKTIRLESAWAGAKLECVFVLSSPRKGPPVCSRNPVMPRPERGSIVFGCRRQGARHGRATRR